MKTVALVGSSHTRKYAPYDKKNIEIWSMNDLVPHLPRVTKWFEMHSWNLIDCNRRDKYYLAKLKNSKIPIYMQENMIDIIPKCVVYPIDEVLTIHGKKFGSTLDYMMALALLKGFERIELYGVDMALYTEYQRQRPTLMYFIGYAIASGIVVYIHPHSGMITNEFYEYDNDDGLETEKILSDIYSIRMNLLKGLEEMNYTKGAIDATERSLMESFSSDRYLNQAIKKITDIKERMDRLKKEETKLIEDLSRSVSSEIIVNPPEIEFTNTRFVI